VPADGSIPGKGLLTHRKKHGVNIQASFDSCPARFTLVKMIACRQQFSGGKTILSVVLNLFLSQVFHCFSI
jgi:hypothetical protein